MGLTRRLEVHMRKTEGYADRERIHDCRPPQLDDADSSEGDVCIRILDVYVVPIHESTPKPKEKAASPQLDDADSTAPAPWSDPASPRAPHRLRRIVFPSYVDKRRAPRLALPDRALAHFQTATTTSASLSSPCAWSAPSSASSPAAISTSASGHYHPIVPIVPIRTVGTAPRELEVPIHLPRDVLIRHLHRCTAHRHHQDLRIHVASIAHWAGTDASPSPASRPHRPRAPPTLDPSPSPRTPGGNDLDIVPISRIPSPVRAPARAPPHLGGNDLMSSPPSVPHADKD
ncbi:hypothetical protein B0H16DRAFT_1730852 [Mycena metata]|uniref:Uncharacterized protein n=1 Tax=Mycena metata TaxID=1033252 RepID=A0AAD7I8I3_9AGAR|nr:hypothetical protein B0H16DRAFT_1730852 [Mycena metata]